jgi:hypothetical protein
MIMLDLKSTECHRAASSRLYDSQLTKIHLSTPEISSVGISPIEEFLSVLYFAWYVLGRYNAREQTVNGSSHIILTGDKAERIPYRGRSRLLLDRGNG